MPRKVVWTNAQDSQIRRLRVEGASWDMIAGVHRASSFASGRRGPRSSAGRPSPYLGRDNGGDLAGKCSLRPVDPFALIA